MPRSFPRGAPSSFLCRYVRRSYAAHQNTWEAMILWVAAVLMAKVMDVDEEKMNWVAGAWLACRAA